MNNQKVDFLKNHLVNYNGETVQDLKTMYLEKEEKKVKEYHLNAVQDFAFGKLKDNEEINLEDVINDFFESKESLTFNRIKKDLTIRNENILKVEPNAWYNITHPYRAF